MFSLKEHVFYACFRKKLTKNHMLKNIVHDFLLEIPVKEVKVISHWVTQQKHIQVIHFRLRRRGKTAICPVCQKRTGKFKERTVDLKRNVKHLFMSSGKEIRLHLEKRRFRCCQRSFHEHYSFEAAGRHTLTFENYILSEWRHLSVLELSRRTAVSDFKLWKIIRSIDTEKLSKVSMAYLEALDEIHLGMDGHSFRGMDMVYVITEVKSGKVIAVLENESKQCVKDWLNSLPPGILKKIKSFVIDMKQGIRRVAAETIGGDVMPVVDHYHLVQEANKMVDEVRILGNWLRKELEKEMRIMIKKARNHEKKILEKVLEKGRIKSYVEIKRRKVFLKAEERLTPYQSSLLTGMLRRCHYLQEAWLNKELFRESMQKKDEQLLLKVMSDCLDSEQYRIRQFGRTIKRWLQEIINFFKLNITNAFTEGKNNKAKLFKRMAYGYRNKESYIRKLYFAL